MVDRCTPSVVLFGDQYAFGLVVDNHCQLGSLLDRSPLYGNIVFFLNIIAELFDNFPVDSDLALFDQFIGISSRVFAVVRYVFVESH